MPVEVQVGERVVRLSMTGGRGTIVAPHGEHVVTDPDSRILKRSTAIEEYQKWRDEQAKKKA